MRPLPRQGPGRVLLCTPVPSEPGRKEMFNVWWWRQWVLCICYVPAVLPRQRWEAACRGQSPPPDPQPRHAPTVKDGTPPSPYQGPMNESCSLTKGMSVWLLFSSFLTLQNKRRQPGLRDSGEEQSVHQKTYCLKLKKVLENICILF